MKFQFSVEKNYCVVFIIARSAVEAALDFFEAETRGSRDIGVSRGLLYLMLAGPGYQLG